MNMAIVSDMGIRHQKIAMTDSRDSVFLVGTPIDRDTFAEQIVIADFDLRGPIRCIRCLAVHRPMTEPGKNRFRSPIDVCPVKTTWLSSLHPSPNFTCGPTTQKGPISTSSPISARASICDRGEIVRRHGVILGKLHEKLTTKRNLLRIKLSFATSPKNV